MTVNHLIARIALAAVPVLAAGGCAARQAARESAQQLAALQTRCPVVLTSLPSTPHVTELNRAVNDVDLAAVEREGLLLLARLRAEALRAFHPPEGSAEGSDTVEISNLRATLDALTLGSGAPLRVAADRFVLTVPLASVLIAASIARGDVSAVRRWLIEAGAPDQLDPVLGDCWAHFVTDRS